MGIDGAKKKEYTLMVKIFDNQNKWRMPYG
jgi:hypothetical protein